MTFVWWLDVHISSDLHTDTPIFFLVYIYVCVYIHIHTHTYTYIYMCICICIYFFLSYLSHEIMAPLDECLWNGLNQPTSHPALMHQGLSLGYCLDVPGSPLTRKVTVGAAVSACATYGSWFWGAAALSATTDFDFFLEKDDLSTEHDSTCLHVFFSLVQVRSKRHEMSRDRQH